MQARIPEIHPISPTAADMMGCQAVANEATAAAPVIVVSVLAAESVCCIIYHKDSNYSVGGNGGSGGGVYSPCGRVRTQAYCEDSTNGISCSDKNKNQTPLISATQLKKISVAKNCPCTSLYCSGVRM